MLGILVGAVMIVAVASWVVPRPSRYSPTANSTRLYAHLAPVCRRVGLVRAQFKLFQLADRAQENHLQWGVRSGQLTVVAFQHPEKIDFNQFMDRVLSHAKQNGITVFVIRPEPNPNRPTAYHVFVEKSEEMSIRRLVESLGPEQRQSQHE